MGCGVESSNQTRQPPCEARERTRMRLRRAIDTGSDAQEDCVHTAVDELDAEQREHMRSMK